MKIVLLPGFGTSEKEFDAYKMMYGQELLVVRYGHASSLEDFMKIIDNYILNLEDSRQYYVLVGHSMGAQLVYKYTNSRDLTYLKSLVFIGGAPRFHPLKSWNTIFSLPHYLITVVLILVAISAPLLFLIYGWNGMQQRLSVLGLFKKNGVIPIKSVYNKTLLPLSDDPNPLQKEIPSVLIRLSQDLLLPDIVAEESFTLIPWLDEIVIKHHLIHFTHDLDVLVVGKLQQWLENQFLAFSKPYPPDIAFALTYPNTLGSKFEKRIMSRIFIVVPVSIYFLNWFWVTYFEIQFLDFITSQIIILYFNYPYPTLIPILGILTLLAILMYAALLTLPTPKKGETCILSPPKVSIIVPMRNEAKNIASHLRSLLSLDYLNYEIIVSDGNSQDNSIQIARQTVEKYNYSQRMVQILQEPPLKQGWVGKSWGCWNAVQQASGEYYLFTDADTFHFPNSLQKAMLTINEEKLVGLSSLGKIEAVSFWEKAILPFFKSLLILLFGGKLTNSAQMRSLAIGQYILVSSKIYASIGGHRAIKSKVADDIHLAQKIATRGRFLTLNTDSIYSVRMYRNLSEIRGGFERNAYESVGNRKYFVVLASLGLFTWRIVPIVLFPLSLALGNSPRTWIILFYIFIFGMGLFIVDTRQNHDPLYLAFLMPLGIMVLIFILIRSTTRQHLDKTVSWKGRLYMIESTTGEIRLDNQVQEI